MITCVKFLFQGPCVSKADFENAVNALLAKKGKTVVDIKPFVYKDDLAVMVSYEEKEDAKVCPICGGKLSPLLPNPGVWTCGDCGQMFGGIPTAPVKGDIL